MRKWEKLVPEVVRSLEEGGEELLTFYQFPRPQWKHGVDAVHRRGVGAQVGATVLAVHVGVQVGRDHCVVQGRVEDALAFCAGIFDENPAQRCLPHRTRSVPNLAEIPPGHLPLEVLPRALNAHRGNTHLHGYGGAPVEGPAHVCLHIAPGCLGGSGEDAVVYGHAEALEGVRELRHEIHVLLPRPRARDPVPFDLRIAHNPQECVEHLVAMGEIDNHVGLVRRGEAVVVHAGAIGGGECDLHVVVVEDDVVEPGDGVFGFLAKARRVATIGIVRVSVVQPYRAHGGHEQHVAVVGNAGTAQVGMAEAVDHAVVVVVARAPVRALEAGVGAQLHHPEGPCDAGKGTAVSAGANERVCGA